tara:strand:+ start:53 stop:1150 length:1098 start_codon:yes stop_codon:yes gene_type:complete
MASKKKRILILNYEFPPLGGGASPVSYEIAKGYAKLGHKVDVITMGYKDLPKEETKEGINIYRVKCLRSKKEICHPWEQLSYLISAKKFLKQHLKIHTYDINHTHFIIPTGVLALWLKKKFDIPYIITAHGSDVLGYNKRFKKLYPLLIKPWKKIIKNANLITTPSRYLQDEIKKITTEGKFIVIPNGIDKNKFKPLKKEKKILIVARLFENKGVQDILDALKDINMQDWKVDIVGEGPYRSFLENKTKENNLTNIVKFHGWIDNKSNKMKELYGKASIFISASYFESFGLTVLEAILAGCYPIISDIQGYKEIFKDKKYFFKKGDVKELKTKINNLIKGKIIQPKFNQDHNWDNIIEKYLGVLG